MLIKVGVHIKPFCYVSISEWQQRVNSQITSVPFGRDYRGDPHHFTTSQSSAYHSIVSNSQHQITHILLIEWLYITQNIYEPNTLTYTINEYCWALESVISDLQH